MAVAVAAQPPSDDRLQLGVAAAASPVMRAGGVVLRASPAACTGSALTALEALEVLMVSRRKASGSYTLPAGKYEQEIDGGSFEKCALRETLEEAGVECEVIFDFGWYTGVAKDGSKRRTRFFAMRWLQESAAWSEQAERRRCWRPLAEAPSLVGHSPILAELFAEVMHLVSELGQAVLGKQEGHLVGRSRLLSHCVSAASMSSDDGEVGNHLIGWMQNNNNSAPDSAAIGVAPASLGTARGSQLRALPETEEAEADRHEHRPGEMTQADIELLGLPETEDGSALPSVAQPAASSAGRSSSFSRKVSQDDYKVSIQDNGEKFCFYRNQVGGHFCLVKPAPDSKQIVVMRDGPPENGGSKIQVEVIAQQVVLKPLDTKEHNFYTSILQEFPSFGLYIPQMFGTKTLSTRQVSAITAAAEKKAEESFLGERMRSHHFQQYIVLQDLASSMGLPRILDLKMGFKQRSKRHSTRKRERCQAKALNSTSHAVGFRICGVHTEEQAFDKYWGRTLPLHEMRGALAQFFLHAKASEQERAQLVTSLLERITGLHDAASLMLGWRFWNTSLLFIHDAAVPSRAPDCRLIDFAHCTRVKSATPDEEFLYSLRNLRVFLEAVRDGHAYESWIADRLSAHPSGGAVQDAEELESEAEPGPVSAGPLPTEAVPPASAAGAGGLPLPAGTA